MTTSSAARATCPICETSRVLRRDGTVREHWQDHRRCIGSGWPPAEVSDPSATTSAR